MKKAVYLYLFLVIIISNVFGKNAFNTIDSLNSIATDNNNKRSEYALKNAQFALDKSLSQLYAKGIGDALHNLAMNNYYRGNHSTTMELLLQSLKVKQYAKDLKGIARTYNMIAVLYDDMFLSKKSLEYHYKAYNIYTKLNDTYGIASQINNIGLRFKNSGDLKKALKYYKASYILSRRLNDSSSESHYLNNIGIVYFEMEEFDCANMYFSRSLEIRKETDDLQGLTDVYVNIGNLHATKKNYKLAIENLDMAFEIALQINVMHEIVRAAKFQSEVYSQMGNCSKSFEYYKIQKAYEDSIDQNELAASMAKHELQVIHDKELKIREIEQLQKDMFAQKAISKQRNARNVFLAGFVFVGIFAVTFYVFYRRKRKDNQTLAFQKNDIKEKNEELIQQQEEIISQKDEIEKQNKKITLSNKLITDSIRNALRIQEAILPPIERFKKLCNDHFIFFKPKDIVSGDYYWIEEIDGKIFFAVVDCTGHGVSGALMSMLSYSLLNQAIYDQKICQPSKILDWINQKLYYIFNQENKEGSSRNSMDLVICCYDPVNKELQFAGARNTMLLIREGELKRYKGDIHQLGQPFDEDFENFTQKSINIQENDKLFLFTDGFSDQFGSKGQRKYTRKRFACLLKDVSIYDCKKQLKIIDREFHGWKNEEHQIDDVLVLGLKF